MGSAAGTAATIFRCAARRAVVGADLGRPRMRRRSPTSTLAVGCDPPPRPVHRRPRVPLLGSRPNLNGPGAVASRDLPLFQWSSRAQGRTARLGPRLAPGTALGAARHARRRLRASHFLAALTGVNGAELDRDRRGWARRRANGVATRSRSKCGGVLLAVRRRPHGFLFARRNRRGPVSYVALERGGRRRRWHYCR